MIGVLVGDGRDRRRAAGGRGDQRAVREQPADPGQVPAGGRGTPIWATRLMEAAFGLAAAALIGSSTLPASRADLDPHGGRARARRPRRGAGQQPPLTAPAAGWPPPRLLLLLRADPAPGCLPRLARLPAAPLAGLPLVSGSRGWPPAPGRAVRSGCSPSRPRRPRRSGAGGAAPGRGRPGPAGGSARPGCPPCPRPRPPRQTSRRRRAGPGSRRAAGPGCGTARMYQVSSTVGAQPVAPRPKTDGRHRRPRPGRAGRRRAAGRRAAEVAAHLGHAGGFAAPPAAGRRVHAGPTTCIA